MRYLRYLIGSVILSLTFIAAGIFIIINPEFVMKIVTYMVVYMAFVYACFNILNLIYSEKNIKSLNYLINASVVISISTLIISDNEIIKNYIHFFTGLLMIFMSWKILSFAHMLAKQRFRYKLIKKIGIYCMTLGIFTALFPKFLSLYFGILCILIAAAIDIVNTIYIYRTRKSGNIVDIC